MPRLRFVCLFVTALVTAQATSQSQVRDFFELTIAGGAREYERLGLVAEERGFALALLARQIYGQSVGFAERVLAQRQLAQVIGTPAAPTDEDAAPADSAPITIPVPLSEGVWRDVLSLPPTADLFIPLVSNRSALLVCAGAASTDASVRALLTDDRGLVRWLVRTAPAGFALVARSLRIANGRMVVPGGAVAETVWETLAAERVSRPADFIRALASRDAGRLAWFFDTLSTMSPARLALVWPNGSAEQVLEQIRPLYAGFRLSDQNWRLEEHPFLRGAADPWMVTTTTAIREGAVAPPSRQWLWQALFERTDLARRDASSIPRTSTRVATLAWLAQEMASVGPRERRDRFEMMRFAQGAFGAVSGEDEIHMLVALGGYRRYRSALLALDRMGITSPATYARVVDAARHVSDRSGRDLRQALISLQGALAILERVRMVRTIDAATAERLVTTLCDAVDRDAPIPVAVAKWIAGTLVPALPPLAERDQFAGSTTFESTILQAMGGPLVESDPRDVVWEGLRYRVDLAAGERQRIGRIREQLQSPGLDPAIASGQAAQIAAALLALVYAPALGDPEGPALLSDDVPQRHDFGLDAGPTPRRELLPWLPPREQIGDGQPWRVLGSILGLDLGLARLALRRIDDSDMPPAPSINLNDEITLARTAMALNPRELTDAARDELVAAIARGRERVTRAGADLTAVTALAKEARLSAALVQALPWIIGRTPESVGALFGLRDCLWLGKPTLARAELDRWGVYAEPMDSRLHTVMPDAAPWEDFGGRAEAGMMGTQAPDLTLRLAQETVRLKLPARLIPALLAYATLDYWHDVDARFPDDLPAMARQALALSPSRVEDYVAALAGTGPLRAK